LKFRYLPPLSVGVSIGLISPVIEATEEEGGIKESSIVNILSNWVLIESMPMTIFRMMLDV
jgi:hypothetical protein